MLGARMKGSRKPDYNDPSVGPPSSATVIGIVVGSIIILIASAYMIYNYSSISPRPSAQTSQGNIELHALTAAPVADMSSIC
jgi:hypothetical protein